MSDALLQAGTGCIDVRPLTSDVVVPMAVEVAVAVAAAAEGERGARASQSAALMVSGSGPGSDALTPGRSDTSAAAAALSAPPQLRLQLMDMSSLIHEPAPSDSVAVRDFYRRQNDAIRTTVATVSRAVAGAPAKDNGTHHRQLLVDP